MIMAIPAGLEPAAYCLGHALEDSHFTGLSYPQAKAVALSIELRNRNKLAHPEGLEPPSIQLRCYGLEVRSGTDA